MNSLLHFSQYYTSYSTRSTYDDVDPAAVIAAIFVLLFFVVIIYVLHAFLLGRIFKKAGVKQWIAWVPFYNTWKMLELGGQQGFWSPLALVPFVNFVSSVFVYIAMYKIGLKLGKQSAFVLLGIFFPTVWLAWLAFDDSTWNDTGTAVTPAYQPPTA